MQLSTVRNASYPFPSVMMFYDVREGDMRMRLGLWSAGLLATGFIVFLAMIVHRNFLAVSEQDALPNAFFDSKPRMAGFVVPAAEATSLRDDELVIGTVTAGQARAYSIGYLLNSEHVNDTIGVHPVLATW